MSDDPREVFTESEYIFKGLVLAPCRHLVVRLEKTSYPREILLHLGDANYWYEIDLYLATTTDYETVRQHVLERLAWVCRERPIPMPAGDSRPPAAAPPREGRG